MFHARRRLLLAGLSLAALAASPAAAPAATVSQSSPNDVVALGQATGSLRLGTPTLAPPEGLGTTAAQLTTGAGGWDPALQSVKGGLQRLFVTNTHGRKFADIRHLQYRALRTQTGADSLNVALKAEVLASGTADYTTLTFEPVYNVDQQAQATGAWQTWDAYDDGDATWWSSRAIPGVCATSCYVTWDEIVAANPNATILNGIHLSVGQNGTPSSFDDFTAWVDGLEIGFLAEEPTTYDFADDGSATIPVAADGSQLWAQVSNAVRSADAGDVVDVAAGTYIDQVVITTPITLRGAGATTVIQSPAALTAPFMGTPARKMIVGVGPAGSGTTIEDLTVDGAGNGGGDSQFIGIGAFDAGMTVDDVRVTRVRENPLNGNQNGNAIWAGQTTAERSVTVTDTTIDDYQKTGIALTGTIDADVRRNTITAAGPIDTIAQNGVQLSGGAHGDVVGNTVTGNDYTGTGWASAGLLVQQAGPVTISDNTLNANYAAVYAYDTGALTITGNTIRDNSAYGVIAWLAESSTITGNTITGNGVGLFAGEGTVGASFNRIAGNDTGVEAWEATVDAEHNWWGCNDAADAACDSVVVDEATIDREPFLKLVTSAAAGDVEAGGATREVSARLESSEGGQPAGLENFPAATVGFTGVLGTVSPADDVLAGDGAATTTFTSGPAAGAGKVVASLDDANAEQALAVASDAVTLVDDSDTTADTAGCGAPSNPCNTVNRGIEAALDGETVEVAAGRYVEQVKVAKPVTLRGAGEETVIESPSALDPVSHNGSTRNVVLGVGPAGSGSTIEDLMVDGAGQGTHSNVWFVGIGAWNSSVTIDGVRVTGVRHTPLNGAQNGLAIWADTQGAVNTVAVRDSVVDDFQKNGITLNGDLDVEVTGNTVTGMGETGTIGQNGIQVSRRATGEVVGNRVSGHDYTNHDVAIGAGVLLIDSEDVQVRGNTLTGNDAGIAAAGSTGTAAFNRLVDNGFAGVAAYDSTVDAQNNWWGCNAGPADEDCDGIVSEDGSTVDATPWLQLSVSANPDSIASGGATSEIRASLRTNSAGQTPAGNVFPDGTTVAFATNLGTIGADAPTDDAVAVQTLRSDQSSGTAQPAATLDGETVRTRVRFGDADGDGLVDNADCAPNDPNRPFRPQGQDQNCDGVRDPQQGNAGSGNQGNGNPGNGNQGNGNQPQRGNAASLASFVTQFGRMLGNRPRQDRGLANLNRIGISAFRRRGTLQMPSNGLLSLLGFGCEVRCTITPRVTLLLDPKAKGATAAKTRRITLRVKQVGVAAGRVGVLRVRLDRKTRRAIRKARRARLSVTINARTAGGGRASDSARYGLTAKR